MASELGVQTIQHTNGTDALTINSSGELTVSNKFPANAYAPALQFIKRVDLSGTDTDTNITDVFSSDFDQYKIVFKADDVGEDADNNIFIRFLKASDGSEESGSINKGAFYGRDNTDTGRGGGTTTATTAQVVNGALRSGGELIIVDPFTSNRTHFHGMSYNYRSSNGIYFYENFAYQVDSTTSYSGLVFKGSNALNGYVLVYGWTGS